MKIKKILKFKMFHPSQWVASKEPSFPPELLNPPTWIEKQMNDAKIEREYENSVKAEELAEESVEELAEELVKNKSWADKYDKDFAAR